MIHDNIIAYKLVKYNYPGSSDWEELDEDCSGTVEPTEAPGAAFPANSGLLTVNSAKLGNETNSRPKEPVHIRDNEASTGL